MSIRKSLIGGALLTAVCLPGMASASFLLNTGDPPADAADYTFSSTQFFADEFSISAGQTVTQLAAYLIPGARAGTAFTFDIYTNTDVASGTKTVGQLNNGGYLQYSDAATFNGSGWNVAGADWVAPTTGNYWLVIEAGSGTSLFAPSVGTQPNAPDPAASALAFAFSTGLNGKLISAGSAADGEQAAMQISVASSTVPLPSSAWMLGSAFLGFGALARRRRRDA